MRFKFSGSFWTFSYLLNKNQFVIFVSTFSCQQQSIFVALRPNQTKSDIFSRTVRAKSLSRSWILLTVIYLCHYVLFCEKKLHTRLSEKYIDDTPSIIKLMLHTFTEFVSKTNLNLYNKICYKENKMLFYSKCGWWMG